MRWEKQIPFTRQERGFSIIEACGDGLTQFDAVVHYEVGPSPPKRDAGGAASLGINQRSLNHRIGFDAT